MKIKLLRLLNVGTKFAIYGMALQCLFLSMLFAKDGMAQEIVSVRKVQLEINLHNASILDAFQLIEKRTNFRFSFDNVDIDRNVRVNLSGKKGSVAEILMDISRQTDLKFRQVNNNINVHRSVGNEPEVVEVLQDITITGKVTGEDEGEGLPGVNIVIKGSATGTITDVNGDFTINVSSPDDVLVFSSVGYQPEEIVVGNRTVINVMLVPDIFALQEIVVIGYGEQRREAVTGSVASMGGDEVREVASTNITQSLQGRIPGVEMTQTNSKPGSEMQIRIRGTRSITAENNPLIVLDGIPFGGSMNDIDPNSIKSVDILKDASATAIYGSRGANGVILISTNRGEKGKKAQISYNAYYGIKNVFSKYPMMDGPQLAALREEAIRAGGAVYDPSTDELENANTDWQDLLYRTGRINSHDLSISKGTDDGNYIFGFGYLNDEAVIPTQGYDRLTFRAALDQEIGKYFRFGLSSNNSYGVTTGTQVGVGSALGASPLASPYDAEGNLKRATYASNDPFKIWTKESVEDVKDLWLSETKAFATYNNVYGEVKVPWVEGLKYRLNVGLNYRQSTGGSFTGKGVASATNPEEPSVATNSNRLTTGWAVENLLSYDRIIAEKHELNVVAMYSSEETRFNRSSFTARDLPSDHFQYYYPSLGEGEITIADGKNALGIVDDPLYKVSGLVSWMGRAMYTYDNRYMLTATIRSDASSRLADGHKWHTYPAVSAGWNIGNESFMQNMQSIDMLKLRVGYGETSNQAIDPYATLGLLGTRFYNFGDSEDGYSTGYYVSELTNENLGWEYTETWNFGLDFGLFSGRLNGTIEYYKQHTKDILLAVELPETSGVGSYMANIGETENKGFELSLNGLILDNHNGWTLEAGVNLYTNKNKLLSLTSGQLENKGNWWFVGHPINVIYDYEKVGIWQEGDQYRDILEPGGNAGMIKVKYTGEYNSDGTPVREINDEDRQIIEYDPKFQGGFNTRLAYKGFDLSIVGSFKNGGTLVSALHGSSSYLNLLSGRNNNVDVNYWTPENTGGTYPRPGGITSGDNPKYGSTLAYFNGSYLKIRTITLGYNFANDWLNKAGINNLRVYASVQNPLVLFSPYHKESGMDPEPNSYGDENQAVTTQIQDRLAVVGTNTPSTRNYLFGIKLSF